MTKNNLINFVDQFNVSLPSLYENQLALDGLINTRYKIKAKEKQVVNKTLAFLVELAELANEVRCFKYWSHKKPSKTDIILEEYADALHFLLSTGNDIVQTRVLSFNSKLQIKFSNSNSKLSIVFLEVFQCACDLSKCFFQVETNMSTNCELVKQVHNCLFVKFLKLGMLLDFSVDDLISKYKEKNIINQKRLYNNY